MDALGVDIGGVIIQGAAGVSTNADTSFFGGNFLATPALPGVMESLKRLVRHFDGQVYLVSKCSPSTAERTAKWLRHNDFYNQTGIWPGRVHYCRERRDKAAIAQQLGLTHFVDDKLEVLGYLIEAGVPNAYLFSPRQSEVDAHAQYLDRVAIHHNWPKLAAELINA